MWAYQSYMIKQVTDTFGGYTYPRHRRRRTQTRDRRVGARVVRAIVDPSE